MNYFFHIIIMINIYIILTVSSNLLVGMTNLVSLGQASFYGLGAYFTVFCLVVLQTPLLPTIIISMVLTSLISLLLALPSMKLKGDYFILVTLGFQMIVYTILYNWIPVTRGPYGIPGIPSPKLFGFFKIAGIIPYLILTTIIVFIIIFIFRRLINSPFGRVLKGIRDDEISSLALGKNVNQFKTTVFMISSAFIAVAGFIYATYVTYIDPTSFGLDESIFILSALLIGGIGNIKGPVAGAIFVVVLPEILRFVGLPSSTGANLRLIIYGLLIIILMRFRAEGIAGDFKVK